MRHWPLFDLSIRTPRLELRYPSLDDVNELAERAAEGVHPEGVMPFMSPWSAADPADRARNVVQDQFRLWGEWTDDNWVCAFVVVENGQVVGVQSVMAKDFAVTRQVGTSSWIGAAHHGRGIGTEMRRAVLHFAFDGLGAAYAVSGAFEDNYSSLAVTRKFGYQQDGIDIHTRYGEPVTTLRFRLPREAWKPADDIEIRNLEPCRAYFGADIR